MRHNIRCRLFPINWKRLRSVPKKAIVLCALFLAVFLYSLVQLARPATYWQDNVEAVQLQTDGVRLIDTFSTKGSRMKLIIEADGQTYYLWYPANAYLQYSESVESLLLTGVETNLSAKIIDNSTLWDRLTGHHRIVDLRCGNSVFYEMETETSRATEDHNALWILFALSGLLWIAEVIYIGFAYGIIALRKRD